MITQNSKEALKARLDIVDVIDSHIELKKAGANFKACCPFHDENTPSFVVSPSNQIWNCFGGCGGGDAIEFVMKYKNLEFPEALEDLAASNNFTLEYERGHQNHTNSFDILSKMSSYFQENLGEEHIAYLKNRGVNEKSIKKFEVGYAGTSPEQIAFLTRNNIPLDEALKVGLLAEEKDRKYARFTRRIMFPIKNTAGKIVGFSGRILSGDRAKYLNTPETKIFDKSSLLYGYDISKESIYTKKTILLFEGQLDVVLAHQVGITTACANLGTAFTDKHIALIRKSHCRVLLGYDGDRAGVAAAYKAGCKLAHEGIDGGVVIFDDGDDPAEMIASGRKEQLIAKLKKPIMIIPFVLGQIIKSFDTHNHHQKNEALKECIVFLNTIKERVIAEGHRGLVAQMLDVDISFVTLGETKAPQVTHEKKNIAEVSIIKSIIEDDTLGDIAVEVMDDEAMGMQREYHLALQKKHDELMEIIIDDTPVYNRTQFTKAVSMQQRALLQKRQRAMAPNASIQEVQAIGKKIARLSNEIRREL